jgi:hypothetical protein
MTKGSSSSGGAAKLIDARIKELGDWRGDTLAQVRALIKEAVPEVTEEWKWRGTPVWEHNGMICTGESYKQVVKVTFAKGAFLDDPSGLFNSSLDGNMRRAIDFREGEKLNKKALRALLQAADALNSAKAAKPAKAAKAAPKAKAAPTGRKVAKAAAPVNKAKKVKKKTAR